jgi:hypothetical protein
VNIEDFAFDVLDQIVVSPVAHARRNPREELPQGRFVIRLGFGEPLACDLDIQVLRASQSQHGGEIDQIRFGCGRVDYD